MEFREILGRPNPDPYLRPNPEPNQNPCVEINKQTDFTARLIELTNKLKYFLAAKIIILKEIEWEFHVNFDENVKK